MQSDSSNIPAESSATHWSPLAKIGRFCFRRWAIVFPIFLIITLASAYNVATNMSNSLAPPATATIQGSQSSQEASIQKAVFQDGNYLAPADTGLFYFSSDALSFKNPDDSKNQQFVDKVNAGFKTIQTEAHPFIGTANSPISSDIFEKWVSKDGKGILLQTGIYGSDVGSGPDSISGTGNAKITDAAAKAAQQTGMTVEWISAGRLQASLTTAATKSAALTTAVATIPAVLIAFLALGSIVGAILLIMLPFIGVPVTALIISAATLTLIARITELNTFAMITLAAIALALGGDYTIHVFYRYRRGITQGLNREDAIGRSMAVEGRSAVVSAVIAAVASLPLLFIPSAGIRSFAWASVCVLLVLAIVTAFFLPAVIGMLGRATFALSLPWADKTSDPLRWRIAAPLRWSLGRPRSALGIAFLVLAILIIPVFWMRPTAGSVSLVPQDNPARIAAESIQDNFVDGVPGATTVIIETSSPILDNVDSFELAETFQSKIEADEGTWFVAGPKQVTSQITNILPDGVTTLAVTTIGRLLTDVADRNLGPLLQIAANPNQAKSLLSGGTDLTPAEQQKQKDEIAIGALRVAIAGVPGLGGTTSAVIIGSTVSIQTIPFASPESQAAEDWVNRIRGYATDVYGPATEAQFSTKGRAYVGGNIAVGLDVQDTTQSMLWWIVLLSAFILFILLTIVLRTPVAALVAVLAELATVGAAFGVMVAIFQWGFMGSKLDIGFIEVEVPAIMIPLLLALATSFLTVLLFRMRAEMGKPGVLARSETFRHLVGSIRVGIAGSAFLFVLFLAFSFSDAMLLAQIGVGLVTIVAVDVLIVRVFVIPSLIGLLGPRLWWAPQWLAPKYTDSGHHPEAWDKDDMVVTPDVKRFEDIDADTGQMPDEPGRRDGSTDAPSDQNAAGVTDSGPTTRGSVDQSPEVAPPQPPGDWQQPTEPGTDDKGQ